ncbi:hypothetical protein G7A72_03330 [Flavobacterium sp. Sr18]|uniref:LPD29 domain-containing protein n=1 Tax=Flavobacterium sp. Sr18 TaxID=935222 RepID=UPI0013E43599|nr:LPD29 domain-containing protein [Flavobacterium sp. Sr18]QIH37890.1 hypothetical protein G7A72_03330 [Flavobacterium sp. Sr18]
MAYIKTETVKGMRNEIKNLFPAKQGWKFSITCINYSTVRCAILAAPIELRMDLTRSHESVNNYYIESHYEANPAAKEVLTKINSVLNQDNYNNSDAMVDYFDVGHYISLSVGEWNKPFQVIQ